jgi:hypothetical protein
MGNDISWNMIRSPIPWSITVNPGKYQTPKIADVTVTVTDLRNGTQWNFYQGVTGYYINTQNFGVNNCIIFALSAPPIYTYQDGDVYRVEVRGLKTKSGEAAVLNYQIEFFSLQ